VDSRPIDREVYQRELDSWLPEVITDCHVHLGLLEHWGPVSPQRYDAIWAMEVARSQSWEQLRAAYRLLFPGRRVRALAFGWVYREVDIERNNAYVLAGARDRANDARALLVTRPHDDPVIIERALADGFLGIKPYPDLAPAPEPSIYDFLPPAHLAALDRAGGLLMLHLPRRGRLGDPDNLRELIEIADAYPRVNVIIAHIGRAYCLSTAQRGLPRLADRPRLLFDTAANLNADVFRFALDTVGPDRLLFGSDLPITLIRGTRDHLGEEYVNWTDGDYSWNRRRKPPEEEARYTFFLYEELRALIAAVQRAGLGREALAKIMHGNAARLGIGD
jgi:hypothetical protein